MSRPTASLGTRALSNVQTWLFNKAQQDRLGDLQNSEAVELVKVLELLCQGQQLKTAKTISWVANESFEISKFKLKFPRARTYELIRALSRLYRSQILQVRARWKALPVGDSQLGRPVRYPRRTVPEGAALGHPRLHPHPGGG